MSLLFFYDEGDWLRNFQLGRHARICITIIIIPKQPQKNLRLLEKQQFN